MARKLVVAERRARPQTRSNARDLAIKQRWGRAPGLIFTTTVFIAMGGFLVAASTPVIDWSFGGGVFTTYLVVTFLVWLVRLRWRKYAEAPTSWRESRAWFVVPFAAGAVMVALIAMDVPFAVRWTRSEAAFDAAARRVRPTPGDRWVEVPDGTIAGIPISEAHREGRNVWFRYEAQSLDLLDATNRFFAYLPDGPDPLEGEGADDASWLEAELGSATVISLGHGWYYVHDHAD